MTDYDFIDPDLPEENSDEETDMNDIPKSEDKIAVEEIVAEMEAMEEEVLDDEEEADDPEPTGEDPDGTTDTAHPEMRPFEVFGITREPMMDRDGARVKRLDLGFYEAKSPTMAAERAADDDANLSYREYRVIENPGAGIINRNEYFVDGKSFEVVDSDVNTNSTDINSDKVAEDNRGFLGRAYNQLKSIL